MKERIEKIKDHINRHKVAYSCGVTAVAVAGITCIIMKGRYTPLATDKSETSVFVRPFSFLSRQEVTTNVVSVIERESRGHPGYIVKCSETLEDFPTQDKAALAEKVSAKIMSMHLRGKIDNINGRHYERIQAA